MAVESQKTGSNRAHLMFDRAKGESFSIKTPAGDDIQIQIDKISISGQTRAHISVWASRDIVVERDDWKKPK